MEDVGLVTLAIIIANAAVTYMGLKDYSFFSNYSFRVDKILVDKDYKRLVTAGFLHADWMHFGFNMLTLFLFSGSLEPFLGIPKFLALYFFSLVAGNLFALYIHRNHGDYSAIGASGAVSGMVFAAIGFFVGMKIGFIFIPVKMPAWLYGLLYVLYTIYGIKSQRGNIGHEAHLGGGIAGLLGAILIAPSILSTNYLPISLILIPTLIFLYLMIKKPHILFTQKSVITPVNVSTFEDKHNAKKVAKQNELNQLLDKINKKGYDNLSKKEKERLDELSK